MELDRILDTLRDLGMAEAMAGRLSDGINLRSSIMFARHNSNAFEEALALKRARDWLATRAPETAALIPADLAIPRPAPLPVDEVDPLEKAYDLGAEAKANGISRKDNPYTGELADAWDEGWGG